MRQVVLGSHGCLWQQMNVRDARKRVSDADREGKKKKRLCNARQTRTEGAFSHAHQVHSVHNCCKKIAGWCRQSSTKRPDMSLLNGLGWPINFHPHLGLVVLRRRRLIGQCTTCTLAQCCTTGAAWKRWSSLVFCNRVDTPPFLPRDLYNTMPPEWK